MALMAGDQTPPRPKGRKNWSALLHEAEFSSVSSVERRKFGPERLKALCECDQSAVPLLWVHGKTMISHWPMLPRPLRRSENFEVRCQKCGEKWPVDPAVLRRALPSDRVVILFARELVN